MAKNDNSKRNQVINIRIDHLTVEEKNQLSDEIVNAKRRIAPEARGTTVEGSESELLSSHKKKIESGNE